MKNFYKIGISSSVMIIFLAFIQIVCFAHRRADSLRTVLKGADRVVVSEVYPDPQSKSTPPCTITGEAKIATLVSKLDFDDAESGFCCACAGDSEITFYRGKEKLAILSHHHGRRLRWHEGKWEGDSLFTAEAAKAWREWFNQQGESRFEAMYQSQVEEEKERKGIHERFLSAFPLGAAAVFAQASEDGWRTFSSQSSSDIKDGGNSPQSKRLVSLFPDRTSLALSLAKGLGTLCLDDASEGSWSCSSSREQLVLECAKSLSGEEFVKVLQSSDEVVLAGAARLFFFEKLSSLLLRDKRGPFAAKLCEAVVRVDGSRNADIAVRALRQFPCAETTVLLERLASGEIPTAQRVTHYKDEPSPLASACMLLAQAESPKSREYVEKAEASPNLDKFDRAALRIAKSFSGERGLIDKSIFELDSYTIGFGALAALEKEGGRGALDVVITGGTRHNWGAVKEEAVLTAQRMAGRKLFSELDSKGARDWHVKEVQEWWEKNRETYPEEKATR